MAFFICCSSAGLSNRILSLCSAMYRADFDFSKVAVTWPRSSCVDCDFDELFDRWPHDKIPSNAVGVDDWRLCIEHENDSFYLWFGVASRRFAPFNQKCKFIDFEYERTPSILVKKYLRAFNFLKSRIKCDVCAQARVIIDRFDAKFVGIHARTWVDCKERQGWFDFNQYCEEIRLISTKIRNFYIACDSSIVSNQLLKWIAKEIPNATVHQSVCNQFPGTKFALIDMLILSKSSVLIGSAYSTLTEVAWWLSECQTQVIVPTGLFEQQKILKWEDTIFVCDENVDFLNKTEFAIDKNRYKQYFEGITNNDCYVIDACAHIGSCCLTILNMGFRAIAIEPSPSYYRSLTTALRKNATADRCKVFHFAPFDVTKSSHVRMCVTKNNVILFEDDNNNVTSDNLISCECLTIDNICDLQTGSEWSIKNVRLIKIEAHGAELFVLQGCVKTLCATKEFNTVVWEIAYNPQLMKQYGIKEIDLLAMIFENGYYVIEPVIIKTIVEATTFCLQTTNMCWLVIKPFETVYTNIK